MSNGKLKESRGMSFGFNILNLDLTLSLRPFLSIIDFPGPLFYCMDYFLLLLLLIKHFLDLIISLLVKSYDKIYFDSFLID